jgi:hypothetical protein
MQRQIELLRLVLWLMASLFVIHWGGIVALAQWVVVTVLTIS